MEYIHNLPFILSTLMAIVIGLISYKNNTNDKDIYVRMAISIVCFYCMGIYVRSSLVKIYEQNRNRKKAEKLEEKNSKNNLSAKTVDDSTKGTVLDLKADDYEDDFSPLKVSEVIRSNLSDIGNK